MSSAQDDNLWSRVQEALDAGREPLEASSVLERWRTASEDERNEVTRLLARLEALPLIEASSAVSQASPKLSESPRRKLLLWAIAAAFLGLPLVARWMHEPASDAIEIPSAVYEAQVSVERHSPRPAQLRRTNRTAERHFSWSVAGESGRLEVR